MATLVSGRVLSSTHGTVKVNHLAKGRFNLLVDLTKRANVIISIPISGFKNLHSFGSSQSLSENDANARFERLWADWEDRSERAFIGQVDRRTRDREQQQRFPYFLEELLVAFDREFALVDLQSEIGAPAPFQEESWVANLKGGAGILDFWYIAYRLSYGETDKEWAEVVRNLEQGMNVWDDVVGGVDVKNKATIHWIDGREEEIPEGEIDVARR